MVYETIFLGIKKNIFKLFFLVSTILYFNVIDVNLHLESIHSGNIGNFQLTRKLNQSRRIRKRNGEKNYICSIKLNGEELDC